MEQKCSLKEKGIQVDHTAQAVQTEKKPDKTVQNEYKTPVRKIYEVLKKATRENLKTIKQVVGEQLLEH